MNLLVILTYTIRTIQSCSLFIFHGFIYMRIWYKHETGSIWLSIQEVELLLNRYLLLQKELLSEIVGWCPEEVLIVVYYFFVYWLIVTEQTIQFSSKQDVGCQEQQ